jgi:hypothetical protein
MGASIAAELTATQGWLKYVTTQVIDVRTVKNGVLRTNSAATNATNLQALIDANTTLGAVLWFAEPVPMDPFTLKSNVNLLGSNLAAFKGATPYGGGAVGVNSNPAGAAFLITNTSTALCTMQSNTSVEGFVCHYPNQVFTAATVAATTTYPATFIRASGKIEGIGLRRICFVGATKCVSFLGTDTSTDYVADLDFDQLYGYPMGGTFIEAAFVADIVRINRCHVNPGAGFQFLGDLNSAGWDAPVKKALVADMEINGAAAFILNVADDFMLAQDFVYGGSAAFHLTDSYGRMSDCAADTVQIGVWVTGSSAYKSIAISNFTGIPVGTVTTASRRSVLFDGAGSLVKIIGMHSFTNVAAQASVQVAGSGAQRVDLTDVTQTTFGGGSWANGLQQVNGSAVITGTVTSY